jgi:hypothetical protein
MSISVFDKLSDLLSLNEWMTKNLIFVAFIFGLSELVAGVCWFRASCFFLAAIACAFALGLEAFTDCSAPKPQCYESCDSRGFWSQFREGGNRKQKTGHCEGCAIALRFVTNALWLVCLLLVWALFRPIKCIGIAVCEVGNPEPTSPSSTVMPNTVLSLPSSISHNVIRIRTETAPIQKDSCGHTNQALAILLTITTLLTIVRILVIMPHHSTEKKKNENDNV